MTKINNHKYTSNFRFKTVFPSLLLLAIFIILCGFFLFSQTSNTNQPLAKANLTANNLQPSKTILKKTPLSSASASVKPKTTTASIPAQYGKSVRIPILMYHYIGNNPNPADKARDNLSVPPDKFGEQMQYLAQNGYNTISFDTLYSVLNGNENLPSKPVILTFDDGYIDFYINAFPILRQYHLTAVSFIPTGLVGGSYYMNWSQIKEINQTGLVSFQAHSVTHSTLTGLSDDRLRYEIVTSKQTLVSQLGKPVNTFAYPSGISNGRVWQAVKNAGYIGAVGTWYGNTISQGAVYDMPRIKISGAWSTNTFASKL